MTLYIIACVLLILFVLLQPGKSDAAAVFGGGANSSAFGPRGTQTVMAKITITAAIVFFITAFLFSIPGLFSPGSVGESVTTDSNSVAPVVPEPTVPAPTDSTSPQGQAPAVVTPQSGTSTGNANVATPSAQPSKPEAKKEEPKKGNSK